MGELMAYGDQEVPVIGGELESGVGLAVEASDDRGIRHGSISGSPRRVVLLTFPSSATPNEADALRGTGGSSSYRNNANRSVEVHFGDCLDLALATVQGGCSFGLR